MSLKATNNVETNKYELEIEISAEDFEAAIEKKLILKQERISLCLASVRVRPRKLIEKEYGEQVFLRTL